MSNISWKAGVSGDWTAGADWNGGAVPGAADSVTIGATGTYEVTLFTAAAAASLSLSAAGATFYDAGTLSVGGTIALAAGTLALAAAGTLAGGTLAMLGGVLSAGGGTLEGVTVQGALSLAAPQSALVVRNGLTLKGAGGAGNGSLVLTGGGSALDFQGSQTLDNATLAIGAGTNPGSPATLAVGHDAGAIAGATLTLGPHLSMVQTGQGAVLACGASGFGGASLTDTMISDGSILDAVAGGTLSLTGGGDFINNGLISISNGAVLSIGCGGFSNDGTLLINAGTLALAGSFSGALLASLTAAPGTLTLSQATVSITGTLNEAGGTLAVGSATALGPLTLSGTIASATILDAGGGFRFATGTGVLSGVTYRGLLDLSAAAQGVTLTGGTAIQSATGGAGTIALTGAGSTLWLEGSETLSAVTIDLGGAGVPATLGTTDPWLASSGTTATLGASSTVVQTGALAALMANGATPVPGVGVSDMLILLGQVNAAVAGGTLTLGGVGSIVNRGTIAVSNDETLLVSAISFGNAGVLSIGTGATAVLGSAAGAFGVVPSWSNTGTIVIQGGTLTLDGTTQTNQLGAITEQGGGAISLAGTLENAGTTLTIGAGDALPALSLAGTIAGGTIKDLGGLLSVAPGGHALLDGVSYVGTLSLAQTGALLRVRDGLTVSGLLLDTGAGGTLAFLGSQTLSAATLDIGAAGTAASIDVLHDYSVGGGSTLTLAASVAMAQTGALAMFGAASDLAGDAIVNDGHIVAAYAGGTLTLGGAGFTNAGTVTVNNETLVLDALVFSNTGQLSVTGGTLAIAGSVTLGGLGTVGFSNSRLAVSGTLALGGGTLSVGTGSLYGAVSLSGTISGGTIADAGGGLLATGGATLDGVTYRGLLDLSRPFAQLTIRDGITLLSTAGAPAGTVALTGAATSLLFAGNQTLNLTTVSIGAASDNYYGQLVHAPEIAVLPGGTLTIAAGSTIRQTNLVATIGDPVIGNWTDSIVNDGAIQMGFGSSVITIGSSNFTNDGVMTLTAGSTQIADVNFVNAATGTITVNPGTALLFELYNYFAAPGEGAASATNAGKIIDPGGAIREMTGGGLFPFVPVMNVAGGLIQGWGLIDCPIDNQGGTIEAKGGQLRLNQAITGVGTLQVDTGAILELVTAIPGGQSVSFQSGGYLLLDQPAAFAGTLANFTNGERIDLGHTLISDLMLTQAGISFVAAGSTDVLHTAQALSGALFAVSDDHGGTTMGMLVQSSGQTVAPVLTASAAGEQFWAFAQGDEFQGASAVLTGAVIGDWSRTDSIDLTDMTASAAHLTYTQGSTAATLAIGDGVHASTITLTGNFVGADFHLASDGHSGTMLTYSG